jgi:hypothetical protein
VTLDVNDRRQRGESIDIDDQILALAEQQNGNGKPNGPTSDDPLRGLERLPKLALLGRDRILALAAKPIVFFWAGIASAGQILLIASGPGEGKTTLLGLCIAARANLGEPVTVLGRVVTPAPTGQWIVVIEAEHGEGSTARKLVRSCRALIVNDECLGRIIILARKDVRLGSEAWREIERMIAAGVVSDIVIDTLARVAPADANDEREQAESFAVIASAIELAPTGDKPIAWVAAHTRKADGQKSLADVSGSAQRTGQADTVVILDATRADGGKVLHSRVIFAKLREDPDDDWPAPVTFSVTRGKDREIIYHCDAATPDDDGTPLEERILRVLAVASQTKTGLERALGRNKEDLEGPLSALFSARRIRSTKKRINGREFKAFELTLTEGQVHQNGAPYPAPDPDGRRGAPYPAPDEHRTPFGRGAPSGRNHVD